MTCKNTIIFKKFVTNDSKEKFYYKNTIKSNIFREVKIFSIFYVSMTIIIIIILIIKIIIIIIITIVT